MTGLVLEGGGARGSYHVGAILALKDRHIKIDAVVGTSIGSINAAFVATEDYYNLYNLWISASAEALFGIDDNLLKAVRNRKLTKEIIKNGITTISMVIKNMGIDTKYLRKILNDNINEEKLRNSKIEYGLCTYSITDQKPLKLFKKDIPKGKLTEYILASSYYPAFKFEKIIDEKYYIDGGVYDRCPVDMLLDKGLDKIYVIKAYRNKEKKAKDTNTEVIYVKPKKSLGPVILFSQDEIRENIKRGYYDTLKVIDKLDGRNYYIKRKSKKYYEKYNLTKNELKFIIGNTKKEKIIKLIESLAKEFDIPIFKVYNINTLMRKVRRKIKPSHRYYETMMKLNIRWW